jgi:hypothetical protein
MVLLGVPRLTLEASVERPKAVYADLGDPTEVFRINTPVLSVPIKTALAGRIYVPH